MIELKTTGDKELFVDDSLLRELEDLDESIRSHRHNRDSAARELAAVYQRVRDDAVYHSNRIEGNSLSYAETIAVVCEGETLPGRSAIDQLEARNLAEVLDAAHALGDNNNAPVTQTELRGLHAILLRGIQNDAGRFRSTQVVIQGSSHLPPPAFQVPPLMMNLSDYLKQAASLCEQSQSTPVVQAGKAHVVFGQIHPFSDGNGRIARALMNLVLMRRGYPPCIILEDDRTRYIDALEAASESGNVTAFLALICANIRSFMADPAWLSRARTAN